MKTKTKKKSTLGKRIAARWQLYLLLLLPIAWLLLFCYTPMAGLVIAFQKYQIGKGIFASKWVGFDNFVKFFTSYNFKVVLTNTLTISLYSLVVNFTAPVLFALLLNAMRGVHYKKIIQTVTYIPHFFSTVIMVAILFQILDYKNGLYGAIGMAITGTYPANLLAQGSAFKHLYVWSAVWQSTGYGAIIYIASLSNVDPTLHEAAMIDGANRFQRLKYIDFPCILPTASIMLILALGKVMSVGYEKVLLMQNSLNLNYSEIISTYVYKVGLANGVPDFSLSTAIGMFNSVVNLILLTISNAVSKKLSGSGIF